MSNAEVTELLLKVPPPAPEQHPIDRALAAIGDAISLALASDKPSKFAEIGRLTNIAHKLGALRPARGVDGVHADAGAPYDEYGDNGAVMGGPNLLPVRPYNEGADINRQMIMLAQGFLREYAEIEKAKLNKPPIAEGRLLEVTELSELFELRIKLSAEKQAVPEQIGARIDYLLKRIGEPPHEPEPRPGSDSLVPAQPLRGHPPDGAGQPDGDRVGEPVADGA